MIYLEEGDKFKCPHCGQGWDVESWNTEYNKPLQGKSEVFCSKCDKKFMIEVWIEVFIVSSPE